MKEKKYRVPLLGRVDTEIEVSATNKKEALAVAYEESEKDTFRPFINFYRDTLEDEVEEIEEADELKETLSYFVARLSDEWDKKVAPLMTTDPDEERRLMMGKYQEIREFIYGSFKEVL